MSNVNYLAQFAKSFNWAGFFLPKNIYQDCSKLYAFCRVLDDLVDEKTNLELRVERFNEIKNIYKKTYEIDNNDTKILNQNEHGLIVNDMIDLAYNNNIKRIILDDLVEGVSSDLKQKVYLRSIKDLLVYSYRVAGTVGLMMAKILNVNDTRSLKGAIDLGIAMQLTNIARDVIEDKKMNRQYIKPDFENIEATLKLADMFYESSYTSIKKIPFKYRFAIIVARRVYRQIGRKIIQKRNMENYEKSGKIYINNFGKIYQTILSLFDLMFLYLKDVESHQRIREHEIIREEINLDERI
ncbi:squalene/phytoene synthase family protein [Candidatus Pelagibacter sp.]|nr:squalene/phytoene synthase family protein [Candidatus Pelagibacter sp.]